MTIHAYLRVSTDNKGQTTENQRKVILDAGFQVDIWYSEDGVSGSIKAMDRPEFKRMMNNAKEGDTCICTLVDRLGRNASDILHAVEAFKLLGIKLRILQFDAVDVTSSMGKMILTVMAACAELERNMISERTVAGMQRTKAQGTKLGQPLKIAPSTLASAMIALAAGATITELSKRYDIPRNTLQRNTEKWKGNIQGYEKEWVERQKQYAKAA